MTNQITTPRGSTLEVIEGPSHLPQGHVLVIKPQSSYRTIKLYLDDKTLDALIEALVARRKPKDTDSLPTTKEEF